LVCLGCVTLFDRRGMRRNPHSYFLRGVRAVGAGG
jgi:hypothetical protein